MALTVDIEKKLGNFLLRSRFEAGNETLAILGASGCGKSMTLKCIAGIETPDQGRIVLDGRVLFDSEKRINLPARKRGVGYLFQNCALFPNMTVRQNIACGIRKDKNSNNIVAGRISMFYLEGLEDLYPSQLSGGQQQRVALARMLAPGPGLIMLDEPFSALDSYLKWQLEQEILSLKENFPGSILFVSHDRDEVYRLCERVVVMEDGRTQETLQKQELYANPGTLSAALLSGCKNISSARKTGEFSLFAQDWNIVLNSYAPVPDDLKYVGFRAHLFETAAGPDENTVECEVTRVVEDMFSIIVMARIKGAAPENNRACLRFELAKEKWEKLISQNRLLLKMPKSHLILLK